MKPLNTKQQLALDTARADVKDHWADLFCTTPENIQSILDDKALPYDSFRKSYAVAVLAVIDTVYK